MSSIWFCGPLNVRDANWPASGLLSISLTAGLFPSPGDRFSNEYFNFCSSSVRCWLELVLGVASSLILVIAGVVPDPLLATLKDFVVTILEVLVVLTDDVVDFCLELLAVVPL
jgi:hypothetical protein